MHRTQIYLQEDEYKTLREHCFKEHISLSEGVRLIIQAQLLPKKLTNKAVDWLLSNAGKYKDKDGRTDVSQNHDDYLWGEP